jgi:hypothetical protein
VFCTPKGFQNTSLVCWQLKTEVLQLPLVRKDFFKNKKMLWDFSQSIPQPEGEGRSPTGNNPPSAFSGNPALTDTSLSSTYPPKVKGSQEDIEKVTENKVWDRKKM